MTNKIAVAEIQEICLNGRKEPLVALQLEGGGGHAGGDRS
jgi:hypothetical protein